MATDDEERKLAASSSQNKDDLDGRDDNESLLLRPSKMKKVPEDVQTAILNLFEVCKENDVEIPYELGKSMLNALSSSGRARASIFRDRLAEDREEVKEAAKRNPVVVRTHALQQQLGIERRPDLNLRIKDGYFKFTERIKETAATEKDPTTQRIPTVYSGVSMKSLWQTLKQIWQGKMSHRTVVEHYPIQNVNLYFEPGKTYLVLGGPRSGKSTLLRMVAGILPEDKEHEFGGVVEVNKFNRKSKDVVWSNIVGYIDQIDRLHPYMTVKETFTFAWMCRTGGTHRVPIAPNTPENKELFDKLDKELYTVMAVLEALGLLRVEGTFVGDQQTVRGVSGGEKKRVTVGEMAVGGFPVMCMDEISTGLDSVTTYDICKTISEMTALNNQIKLVSLLQPPPEAFCLFDNVILLGAGKVIYSGPVEEAVPYFESLGYELPERMDVANWLQTLPTKDGAQYMKKVTSDRLGEEGPASSHHLSTQEFHELFYQSDKGKSILEKVEKQSGTKNECLQGNEAARKWSAKRFHNPWTKSLKLLVHRELLLWWRDKAGIKSRIVQDLIMGIIAGTLFWQAWEDVTSVVGILFQSMFFISVGATLKVAPQYAVRGILYKHQDANFFPTWTYVLGRSIATIPSSLIDGLLYGTIIFWFVGLAHNDGASFGNYIMFVLITTFTSISLGLLFSIFSAVTKDQSTGQAFMSISMVFLLLFSGFTVQPSVLPTYWIWVYWLNIFAWAFRALMVNEYASGKYDNPSMIPGLTEGQLILKQLGFVDQNGYAYQFEWAPYSIAFSLLISFISIIVATICLVRVRFATGKSLANNTIEEIEDSHDVIEKVETELPFQRVSLTFRDIHYTVVSSIGNEKLELLKGVNGVVEAGKLTALMGASGAGKTTLMDVLSMQKRSGEVEGDVRLNGHPQEELSFRRCTGYVEQFDVQSAALTIRETCEFSAQLRLESSDASVTKESRRKFIDQTLDMLELTPIQHFQVGNDATGGLSFEQKKRLSIAVELVANPSIIFLDEPTSGLDARAAAIVMRGLKRIALTGRAVCATIHQPSIPIFDSFDTLLLLKRGGEAVYYGDLGKGSSHLISYLQSFEATPSIQPGENPATWMLSTIGSANSGSGEENNFDYAMAYQDSLLHKDCLKKIQEIENSVSDNGLIHFSNKFATSTITQVRFVFQRAWTIYWRSPSYNRTRIIVSVLLSLLIGSVYVSNRTPKNEADMNSRVTTIYISFLVVAVSVMNTVLAFFEAERNMYYRHKAALMYDTSAISFAFTVAELPFLVGTCFLYTTIFYFMVGFAADAVKFFLYYMFMWLCMACFTYLGQMFVAISQDAVTGQGFGALFVSSTSLFAGVLIRPENIPEFWKFMYWLLPGHYILEGLLVTQFQDDQTAIQASTGSAFWDYLDCDDKTAEGATECYGTTEEWVFATFGGAFVPEHVPANIGYLVGLLVLTRLVTLAGLQFLNFRKT